MIFSRGTKIKTVLSIIAGVMLLMIGAGMVEAQSTTTIYGTISKDGSLVSGEHKVTAVWESDSSVAGSTTATNGAWAMDINAEDSVTGTLHFYVETERMQKTIGWPWDKTPVALEIPQVVQEPTPTPAPAPTYTPQPPAPTYTPQPPAPTYTPQPPAPTYTPQPPAPTHTPQPTYIPQPTYTPIPTSIPTPASPTDSAGGRVEGFDSPPRISLRPVVDIVGSDEDGLIEFAMANPRRNSVNLEVELILRVPSGIHIYSSDGTYASGAGMGSVYYLVKPGDTRTIQFFVQADKVGRFTISGTAEYGPEHHRTLWNPLNLTHPFTVEQATSRSRVRAVPTAEELALLQQQGGEPGGCSIGASGAPIDLSAVMFGGAMLTGMGMILVRRRRD